MWTKKRTTRTQMLLLSGVSIALSAYANAGGTCTPVTSSGVTIGLEYIAISCPQHPDDMVEYISGSYECRNGQISPTQNFKVFLTPSGILAAAGSTNYRTFSNPGRSHMIFVHRNFTGTLDINKFMHTPAEGEQVVLPDGFGCAIPAAVTDPYGPGLDCNQSSPTNNPTNPINPAWRGNKVQVEVDYAGEGPFPLSFFRTYNSRATRMARLFLNPDKLFIASRIPKTFAPQSGSPNPPVGRYVIGHEGEFAVSQTFGFSDQYGVAGSWTHNYSMSAEIISGTQNTVTLRRANGSALLFGKLSGNWVPVMVNNESMAAAPAIAERLVVTEDVNSKVTQLQLIRPDDVTETYNAAGQLIKLTDRSGLSHTLAYVNGRLNSVTHSNGASLQFFYDGVGRLEKLTLPDLNVVTYAYNNYGAITRVTYPDDTPTVTTDNPWRDYQYGKTDMPLALTGMTDNGVQYARWDYDSQGRATKSWHGAETDPAKQADLAVVTYDAAKPDEVVITDASGTARTYNYLTRANRRVSGGVNQPGGAGCGPASQSMTYDANGNVATRTDYRGYVTEYVYDLTRNLETSRTEAKGTSDERTIGTQWHATFRLPKKVTEEGRVTEYDYDERGNLITLKIVDTADGNTSRTTTFTNEYNGDSAFPYLKKVTVDGPRTGVNDVTVYAFGSKGYLSSVSQTTTAGLVLTTLYEDYDANGRVRKITRPDGVVIELRYNARGQLSSSKVGVNTATPLETLFDYYPATTLLQKVTQPDGSFVRYEYDTARRLTHVYDNAGNYIKYQLNRAGQPEVETVNDTAGALAASLLRINQAQQTAQLPSPYKGQ